MSTSDLPASTTTPRQILISWANDQDSWVRSIVGQVLSVGGALPSSLVEDSYAQFLIEKRFETDVKFVASPPLTDDATAGTAEPRLLIHQLRDLQGVNALSGTQPLDFDDHLTVMWGQNGSGKTGYARVVKRAAAVRTHEEILGNAWSATASPDPSATFEISLDGERSTLNWANELGLGPLGRISVFDAKAASIHVDSDLGYVYTPAELALFTHVTSAIQAVQAKVDGEMESLKRSVRPDLTMFHRGTPVYSVVESLGAATDLRDLETLAVVPDTADEDLERLRAEVAALASNQVAEQLSLVNRIIADITTVRTTLVAVAAFKDTAHSTALDAERVASAEATRVRSNLFEPSELAGKSDEEWQAFIVAGERFQRHLGDHDYPNAGDRCLYCRQELSDDARALVQKYSTFLDESTQRQLAAAVSRTDQLALKVAPATLENVRRLTETIPNSPSWLTPLKQLLADVGVAAEECSARKPTTPTHLDDRATQTIADIDDSLVKLRGHAQKLSEQTANRSKVLPERQAAVADLADRVELARRLPALIAAVTAAKRAERLRGLSSDISTRVRRSLTTASKLASEDLVNRNFESLFREECQALNAPAVALTFQGRSGHAERKKAVFQYRPSAILSEGEQKVLALADFLAECRMNGTTAPILFDDPVTSLDYRRLDEVAKRICELADLHQVIVLTHNVMFASALIANRQSKQRRVKCIEVRENGFEKGVLAVDVEPRFDSPKDLGKRINVAVERIRKADPAVQDALIAQTYDLMRSWCEAFTEQELLANVTQRYRANVMMTKLGQINVSRLGAAVAIVSPAFDKICRHITGHSNPFEQSNVSPTLDDLMADWKMLCDARDAYMAAQ